LILRAGGGGGAEQAPLPVGAVGRCPLLLSLQLQKTQTSHPAMMRRWSSRSKGETAKDRQSVRDRRAWNQARKRRRRRSRREPVAQRGLHAAMCRLLRARLCGASRLLATQRRQQRQQRQGRVVPRASSSSSSRSSRTCGNLPQQRRRQGRQAVRAHLSIGRTASIHVSITAARFCWVW
jgi:hypothetical protein